MPRDIRDDQRGRGSPDSHAEREAVALRADDAAVVAAGVLEAVQGLRRLQGSSDMPRLVMALRARERRLGLEGSVANVA